MGWAAEYVGESTGWEGGAAEAKEENRQAVTGLPWRSAWSAGMRMGCSGAAGRRQLHDAVDHPARIAVIMTHYSLSSRHREHDVPRPWGLQSPLLGHARMSVQAPGSVKTAARESRSSRALV